MRAGLLALCAGLLLGCAVPAPSAVTVSIATQAPQLQAEQVETAVTDIIERALTGVPGVGRVRSVSSQARSYIEVSISNGDSDAALTAVRAVLARPGSRLPATAAQPVLRIEARSLWWAPSQAAAADTR